MKKEFRNGIERLSLKLVHTGRLEGKLKDSEFERGKLLFYCSEHLVLSLKGHGQLFLMSV